jgi:hypothetical protein
MQRRHKPVFSSRRRSNILSKTPSLSEKRVLAEKKELLCAKSVMLYLSYGLQNMLSSLINFTYMLQHVP